MDYAHWESATRKLLVTDNISNVQTIIRRINSEGKPVLGVDVKTPSMLAGQIIARALAENGSLQFTQALPAGAGALIMEDILRKSPELAPFVPQECMCTMTAGEIVDTLRMIRENSGSDAWQNSDDGKVSALQRLAGIYEEALSDKKLHDPVSQLKTATEVLREKQWTSPLPAACLFFEKQSGLQQEFVRTYAPDAVELPWPEGSCGEWHFVRSYGIWNEVQAVLQDIRTRQIPFGDVRIVYTSPVFETPILAAFGERQVPISLTTGRSAADSDAIRLMLCLLDWALQDYDYALLKPVVMNPAFRIPVKDGEDFVNASYQYIKGIEKDKIGWGIERYREYLAGTQEKKHSQAYLTFLEDLVAVFDRPADNPQEQWARLLSFVQKYTSRNEEMNRRIYPLLKEQTTVLQFMGRGTDHRTMLRQLKDHLLGLRLDNAEDSRAVSACRISSVTLLDRPHLYVIGLADTHYRSASAESPVLNDDERKRYFPEGNVPLAQNTMTDKLAYYLRSLQISKAEDITVSYTAFDTVRQEPLSPSALYLTLHDLYGEGIEEEPAGYPRVLSGAVKVSRDEVWQDEDMKPAASQETAKLIECMLSPTALDLLIRCPAKYYLQKQRKIAQEDYSQPSITGWMNAKDKGTFFHMVMERYVSTVFIGKDIVSAAVKQCAFEDAFAEAREFAETSAPVLSAAIAEVELAELRQSAMRYLEGLHLEFSSPDNKWHVVACEEKIKHKLEAIKDQKHDVTFSVTIEGIIDRVDSYTDENGQKHFRLVDYKTGRIDNFTDKVKLTQPVKKNGQTWADVKRGTSQHLLYKMVKAQEGSVDEFVYAFVMEEGDPVPTISVKNFWSPFDEGVIGMLYRCFVLKNAGANSKITDQNKAKDICKYCTYADVCPGKLGVMDADD